MTSDAVIRHYLEDAIAAEKTSETQLGQFAREGDDEEVRAAFAAHVQETQRQHERLTARLEALGGGSTSAKTFLAQLFSLAPKPIHVGHDPEERIAQNLVLAYTLESGECAMYEALAAAAEAAGDDRTEQLAREIQAQERQAADRMWRLINSRAKIAFNLLTIGETDPSVNTKVQDNPLI